jgi:hypothetical protein
MATELLNKRIKDIMCMRAKVGYDDPTPTLVDIERTHILFVNAHFKPFKQQDGKSIAKNNASTCDTNTVFDIQVQHNQIAGKPLSCATPAHDIMYVGHISETVWYGKSARRLGHPQPNTIIRWLCAVQRL